MNNTRLRISLHSARNPMLNSATRLPLDPLNTSHASAPSCSAQHRNLRCVHLQRPLLQQVINLSILPGGRPKNGRRLGCQAGMKARSRPESGQSVSFHHGLEDINGATELPLRELDSKHMTTHSFGRERCQSGSSSKRGFSQLKSP